jgi:hypothetical protein
MKNNTGLFIVAIIIIAALIWWFGTRQKVKGGTMLGYKFFQHMDSPEGDLVYLKNLSGNIPALKENCDKNPECQGFNTAGYLKKEIYPNKFKEYSGYPDWSGLYVKRKVLKNG